MFGMAISSLGDIDLDGYEGKIFSTDTTITHNFEIFSLS